MTSGPEPVPGVTDGDGLGVTIYRKVKGSHSLMVNLHYNTFLDYFFLVLLAMEVWRVIL